MEILNISNLYGWLIYIFSEKRRPNTLYQELSYQEGENVPEGDDANDIAGIVHIENCLCSLLAK